MQASSMEQRRRRPQRPDGAITRSGRVSRHCSGQASAGSMQAAARPGAAGGRRISATSRVCTQCHRRRHRRRAPRMARQGGHPLRAACPQRPSSQALRRAKPREAAARAHPPARPPWYPAPCTRRPPRPLHAAPAITRAMRPPPTLARCAAASAASTGSMFKAPPWRICIGYGEQPPSDGC